MYPNVYASSEPIEPKYAGTIVLRDGLTGEPKTIWRCEHQHKDAPLADGELPGYVSALRCAEVKLTEVVNALAKGGIA